MGLSADVKKFAKMAKAKQLKVVKVSLFATFNGSIIRSPVGNEDLWKYPAPAGYVGGQFRANWRVDLNGVSNNVKNTESGSESLNNLTSGIAGIGLGDTIYFTNPMSYGPRLEYDSWSTQAPDGMVRVSAREFKRNVEKAIAKTR